MVNEGFCVRSIEVDGFSKSIFGTSMYNTYMKKKHPHAMFPRKTGYTWGVIHGAVANSPANFWVVATCAPAPHFMTIFYA